MAQSKHYFNLTVSGTFEPQEDGGLLVNNVTAMAPGEWTSMQGIFTRFKDDVLKRDAQNWAADGVWSRHQGNEPRNTNERVGVVRNPRYEEGKGVVVDMYLHGKSSFSADLIDMVQLSKDKGGIKDVSAETLLDLDPRTGDVNSITFTGLAIVDMGACETCKIPAFAAGNGGNKMATDEGGASDSGGGTAETLVSVARDIFREMGYPEIADLLDMAVNLDGDEKAQTEIMAKLKEKAKGSGSADEASIAEIIEPFSKKLDEYLAYAKQTNEKIEAFGKSIGEVKADVKTFGQTAFPRSKGYTDFGASTEPVVYEENRPQIVRGKK